MSKVDEYQQLKAAVEAGKEKHVRSEAALDVAKTQVLTLLGQIKDTFKVAGVKPLKALLDKKEAEAQEALAGLRDKIAQIKEEN